MLAELGYVAFAADLYGDHKVTTHAADAQDWMTQITANQAAWQQRAQAGLDALKASDKVDGNPEADSYGIPGVKYDAKADARSWALMKDFLHEIFTR